MDITFNVFFNGDTSKIKEFVDDVSEISVDVLAKNKRYIIDAKSIMGMFSLDTKLGIEISASATTQDDIKKLQALKEKFA